MLFESGKGEVVEAASCNESEVPKFDKHGVNKESEELRRTEATGSLSANNHSYVGETANRLPRSEQEGDQAMFSTDIHDSESNQHFSSVDGEICEFTVSREWIEFKEKETMKKAAMAVAEYYAGHGVSGQAISPWGGHDGTRISSETHELLEPHRMLRDWDWIGSVDAISMVEDAMDSVLGLSENQICMMVGPDSEQLAPEVRRDSRTTLGGCPLEKYAESLLSERWDRVLELKCQLEKEHRLSAREVWSVIDPDTFEDLEGNAYSYAAGIIASWLLGIRPHYVSLIGNYTNTDCFVTDTDEEPESKLIANLVVAAASSAAEVQARGSRRRAAARKWQVQTSRTLRHALAMRVDDAEVQAALMNSCENVAAALVGDHWDAIDDFAQELLRCYYFADEDLHKHLIDRVGAMPPEISSSRLQDLNTYQQSVLSIEN